MHKGGKFLTLTPFNIYLEQKPSIISIDNITTHKNDYDFWLQFTVNYRGADYLTVEIEEDYNTTLRTSRIEEPFLAHVTTGKITSLDYNWVTIIVSNKYGEVKKTLEFAPDYLRQYNTSNADTQYNDDVINCQLIQLDGRVVYSGNSDDLPLHKIRSGLYIVKKQMIDGSFITYKININ